MKATGLESRSPEYSSWAVPNIDQSMAWCTIPNVWWHFVNYMQVTCTECNQFQTSSFWTCKLSKGARVSYSSAF